MRCIYYDWCDNTRKEQDFFCLDPGDLLNQSKCIKYGQYENQERAIHKTNSRLEEKVKT